MAYDIVNYKTVDNLIEMRRYPKAEYNENWQQKDNYSRRLEAGPP